jgi:4-aminobutyrate aminotransferase
LKDGLIKLQQKHNSIVEVRGFGLMLGVEFETVELRDRVETACFERGLIILGAGSKTIRWSPPLILTKENVDVALEIFDEAITASV